MPPSHKPPMRLQARSAYHKNQESESEEEEEDDDLDFLDGPKRRKPKKESLKDLFASEPPWAASAGGGDAASGLPPLPKSGGGGSSSKMAKMMGEPASAGLPPSPASATRNGPSLAPPIPSASPSVTSSNAPRRKMVAKDERKPPPGTKDLMFVQTSAILPL